MYWTQESYYENDRVYLKQGRKVLAEKTSKHKGVCYDSRMQLWRVQINFGKYKNAFLGNYRDEDTGGRAFRRAVEFLKRGFIFETPAELRDALYASGIKRVLRGDKK